MCQEIKHASDATFEADVIQSSKPVLVDFWAPWCGPCKTISPILEDLAKDYGDRLQIVKISVDDNESVPLKLGVRGIPALFIYKDGVVVAQKAGAMSKLAFKSWLDQHV
jgi:thioredoxin 1